MPKLQEVEKEIANLVNAIKSGADIGFVKDALQEAEAKRKQLATATEPKHSIVDYITAFMPVAIDRYKQVLGNLRNTIQSDTAEARHHLKTLIGDVKLFPHPEGYLEAEIQRSMDGLLAMAVGNEKLKVCLVAGAGFEPAAFRL